VTGLPDRRAFNREIDSALQDASGSRSPLSLIVVDLDHFKRVNDKHGVPPHDNWTAR